MQRQLQRLSWKNIRDLVPDKVDTVLFPVGTIEAHGAAAIGTDNLIPESIAEYLAERINAVIAPTLNYGITKSLYGYPGSMTIQEPNFESFIKDILKSFYDAGFEKIIVLNGHGGNNSALKAAAHEFYYLYRVKIAVIHWWELCADLAKQFFGESGGHAGLDENAMVQAIDESLVDASLYDDDMPYFFRAGANIYPVPGSILLYKENEGIPDFNAERSREYQQKVFEKIEEFLREILGRWEKI
jgi:creatinine amidohydrolase